MSGNKSKMSKGRIWFALFLWIVAYFGFAAFYENRTGEVLSPALQIVAGFIFAAICFGIAGGFRKNK